MLAAVGGAAVRTSALGRPVALRQRARWSTAAAWTWREQAGWLVGCNFTPSTASNQLELWQADTFDPTTIDRELGWATELGMNSIRLFLHDLVHRIDGDEFLDRIDRVLDLAAGHGIGVMPVLFDGIWCPTPRPGPQPEPRPGVHNSRWLQGPGAELLADRSRWATLRAYVEAVLARFGDDDRVVVWDLFNEPDSPNPSYVRTDPPGKAGLVADLLEEVWDWAVAVDPAQPLTVGVYLAHTRHPERASRVARTAIERSDVVSFHSYAPDATVERTIATLAGFGRPLLCTEWLARPRSPVAQLEVFRRHGVGAYCWGLVDGRTQTRFPWTSWWVRTPASRPWFHELLRNDGAPHDPLEADTFRRIAAQGG